MKDEGFSRLGQTLKCLGNLIVFSRLGGLFIDFPLMSADQLTTQSVELVEMEL